MDRLIANGVDKKAILHINFEEPGFSPYLKLALSDEIYDLYRARVFPKGKAYIFLDEIQNVPEWERWVRARNDTETIKIFITGSSSALLSGELATVLTGRNLTFPIYPLSFLEMLTFKGIEVPSVPLMSVAPPEVEHALVEYLQWGGFPRVVLSRDDEERERLLKRYFDELLFKDVVQRHEIRNVTALRNIAIHLLTHTASLTSYKRLSEIFQVSPDLAQSYVQYLKEAFLVMPLSFYSLKASERTRNPFKVHAIDLGFRKITSLATSRDNGKCFETLLYGAILREEYDNIFYWKDGGEIDFLVQQGINITGAFQAVYEGLDDQKVLRRELGAFKKAKEVYPDAKQYLITWKLPDNWDDQAYESVTVLPLWRYLLGQV